MQRVAADDLSSWLTAPSGVDLLASDPCVVVDVGAASSAADASAIAASAAGVPAVLIALGDPASPLATALDVCATERDVDDLIAAVDRTPHAATSLAMLLRGGATRSIADGLVAESATYSMLQAGPDHRSWLAGRRARDLEVEPQEPIRVERDDRVLHITLDRPARRNAFNARMRDLLCDVLGIAVADPSLQVVIDAAGPAFCSGGDLDEFGTAPDPATAHLVRTRRSVGRVLAMIAERVEVRVHGACVGAGIELPAFAGRIVAAADATFRLPEVAMGLIPGAGGTVSIPQRVGRQQALQMALTGESVDAPTALAWGLIPASPSPHLTTGLVVGRDLLARSAWPIATPTSPTSRSTVPSTRCCASLSTGPGSTR